MDERLKRIVLKQFSIIGKEDEVETTDFLDNKNPWFWKYTYTKEQEKEFAEWFENELYTDTDFRKFIMKIPKKSKKYIKDAVAWYLFLYGFSVREDNV